MTVAAWAWMKMYPGAERWASALQDSECLHSRVLAWAAEWAADFAVAECQMNRAPGSPAPEA